MVIAHALCDFPLQGQFLSQAKNHRSPLPGIDWLIALAAHAAIQAGAVWYITGMPVLGLIEFAFHMAIDYAKCEGVTTFRVDQMLHVGCKLVYVLWIVLMISALPK